MPSRTGHVGERHRARTASGRTDCISARWRRSQAPSRSSCPIRLRAASTRRISSSAARPTSSCASVGSRVPSTRWSSWPGRRRARASARVARGARTTRRPRRRAPSEASGTAPLCEPASGAARAAQQRACPRRWRRAAAPSGASRSGRAPWSRRARRRRPARRRRSPCARRRGRRRGRRRAGRSPTAASEIARQRRSRRRRRAPAGAAPRRPRAAAAIAPSTVSVLERQLRLAAARA